MKAKLSHFFLSYTALTRVLHFAKLDKDESEAFILLPVKLLGGYL